MAEKLIDKIIAKDKPAWPAFLALWDEIAEALEKGASARRVWQELKDEGRIGVRYETFTKYVRKKAAADLKGSIHARSKRGRTRDTTEGASPEPERGGDGPKTTQAAPAGFVYDQDILKQYEDND
jgi:hypothetical protein